MPASPDSRAAWVTSWCCLAVLVGGIAAHAMWSAPRSHLEAVRLGVTDVPRTATFFEQVLGFQRLGGTPDELPLMLGNERLVLLRRPSELPTDAPRRADDLSFQHLAIVVSDMDAAVDRLKAAGVEFVSDGPQRLPDSNLDAGGIRAVYFRDPDGHVLELIQFPPLKGEPRWQRKDGGLFLGIDHTAVVVRDSLAAIAFYRDRLGMTLASESINAGVEQAALTGVPDANVRITSLRGSAGVGVELLEYRSPRRESSASITPDWAIVAHHADPSATSRDPAGHVVQTIAVAATNPLAAVREHWPRYLLEAAQLGLFMVVTVWATLLLEHPSSPVRRKLSNDLLRRVIMGAIIGLTVVLIIRSAVGRSTGSHFNPAVTLAMLFLGRIAAWDALFYVIAQFVGGTAGVLVAAAPFWKAAAHEKVNFAATLPGPRGVGVAIVAELIITFALFTTLLLLQQSVVHKHSGAFAAGGLLLLYIAFEAPLSGMSLNPARSVASAVAARRLGSTWPYFVAPLGGMTLAAALFGR